MSGEGKTAGTSFECDYNWLSLNDRQQSTDGVSETSFQWYCIVSSQQHPHLLCMHMYCRFREPVVDLRFSRCPSFVCRCSSIFWIPQRLAVDIVIVITVDQMLSFPPLIAKQQTTDITITPFLRLLPTTPQRLMTSLMRRRCDYCSRKRKAICSPRCLVHRILSCTMSFLPGR